MRIASLIPLVILIGGVFVALATERFIASGVGIESMPRLDMQQMRVHSFEQHNQRTSFLAQQAVFAGNQISAQQVSGRLAVGDEGFDFDAARMQVQGGRMLLEDAVELRNKHSTLSSQRVELSDDGSLQGAPARVIDARQDATFAAEQFSIDPAGGLRLQGGVQAVFGK
ncbi:MAG: hypothetical protein OXC81_05370 [Betaproteobacteria bacterium]|nr:hypothetical protein [Betaproteobacteria bacterium]